MIFVFGSNLSGRHGKGAALTALREHGAQYGVAEGLTGNAYALPTCGHKFEPLPYTSIIGAVYRFADFVKLRQDLQFKVTRVGCGLGRYRDEDIAPFFKGAPANCFFDTAWKPWIGEEAHYWGTF